MTTKLETPVFRELETEVEGRKVIAGLVILDTEPYLTIRLKGKQRTRRMSLKALAETYLKQGGLK